MNDIFRGQPRHVKDILFTRAALMRDLSYQYSLEQLRQAYDFACNSTDLARAGLWSRAKQVALERVIRQREKAQRRESKWKMSMWY
ncbi:MAG: hypothetical protein N2117_12735 [Anaerolineales bacterium]|nr:hypothetical protein [Anaerolineales bacterium]